MYRVHLIDPLVCIARSDLYLAINRQLQGYFDRVAKRLARPEQVLVAWIPAEPEPKDNELLVHFTSEEYSVVSRFSGNKFDPAGMSHWGYTQMKTVNGKVVEAASEVYVKMLDADILSKLASTNACTTNLR